MAVNPRLTAFARNDPSGVMAAYGYSPFGQPATTGNLNMRMAADGNQNFLQQALSRFKGGKAGGATKLLSKAGIPLAGLSVLGSAMAAGQEFNGEGAGVDASQAAGRFVGDLGTTATLATLGTMIAPGIGTVALPVLGALLGVNEGVGKAGAGIGEAIYTGVTGDTEARRKASRYRLDTQLEGERAAQLAPVYNTICLLYTSPSPRDATLSRMPSSA